jgi:Xaa-Pro aminopeptidase
MHEPVLTSIDLPDFGRSDERPVLPADVYAARLDALRERAERDGYDRLVVYADREHSANLAWLTGFDPRFEEAVLIVAPVGEPLILVGNECYGMDVAAAHPHAWERIQARRSFMANALGIELHPDVLPFSNLPAYLPPFLLRPDRAMTVAAS